MKSKRSKNKIREIAQQEGLDIRQVEDIVNAPFRFTSKIMKEGDIEKVEFSNVRIFRFGIFLVKQGRKKRFIEKGLTKKRQQQKKNEKINRNKKQRSDNFPGSSYDQAVQEAVDEGPDSEEG